MSDLLALPAPSRARRGPSVLLDSLARRAVVSRLRRLSGGAVTFEEGALRRRFGDEGGGLAAAVAVRDPRFWREVALGGTVGAAEAYAEGLWDCDDLVALVRTVVRSGGAGQPLEAGLARLGAVAGRARHALRRRNTRALARRNVADHYDLGNDFFALFLDETLTYSCGIFEGEGATLRDASLAKLDRVCRKLGLGPGQRVLEIGCGWGSFALHAASRYGCRVTATTLSRDQQALATERVRAAGLAGQVQVLLQDWRDLAGRHDRVVSIEMIEAVGWRQYADFFRASAARLEDDGMMLLQGITLPDREFERAKRDVDHVKAHVFPGTTIPSVSALCAAAARGSDLRLVHLEEIGPHYAPTLRAWRERLRARWDDARRLGKTERFLRMFEYYLAYCEAAFEERYLGDAQMVLARPGWRAEPILPPLGTPAGAASSAARAEPRAVAPTRGRGGSADVRHLP